MTHTHFLKSQIQINKPISEVFHFFSKAENLNLLTPPELNFKIVTPLPIVLTCGAVIDYRIQLSGFPFSCKTEITSWNPPYQFVDTQLQGPYETWIHEHRFESKDTYTIMHDLVEYRAKGWIFEPLIQRFFVAKRVKEIFEYRTLQINRLFNGFK